MFNELRNCLAVVGGVFVVTFAVWYSRAVREDAQYARQARRDRQERKCIKSVKLREIAS